MNFEVQRTDSNNNCEISINEGDVLVFVGANGSGKTRLGYYLERRLFSLTNIGIEQKQSELKNKKQELDGTERTINALNIQLMEIRNSSDEKIAEDAISYQQQRKVANDRSVYTHLELANLAISGQISPVTFQSNRFTGNTVPPQSLNEISGGQIILGDIYLEVDLLKVTDSNVQSINNARNYSVIKLDTLLESSQRQRDQLLEGIEALEAEVIKTADSNFNYCERISAHRSLVVHENLAPKGVDEAVNELLFGNANQTQNTDSKWGSKPFETFKSDFDKLMIAFVSQEADVGARFRQSNNRNLDKPATNFDKALAVWNQLLPHRTLRVDGLKLFVQTPKQNEYVISEMSEGERSLFYILGKCLFAKSKSLIIIDEPDIHIHKAILSSFFSSIEKERSDCAFIYITHDLEFAVSRRRSKIYVLHSYEHENKWDIQEIQSNAIPELIYSQVCGSRKNILFVEGKPQSLDRLYSSVYDTLQVVSVGSCEEVKSYTKSMNHSSSHHRVKCFGLIDRDDLDEAQIAKLLINGIYVLPVAVVENIFLLPNVAQHIFRITGEEAKFDHSDFAKSVIDWIHSNEDWKSKSIKQRITEYYSREIGRLPSKIRDLSSICNQRIQGLDPKAFVDEFEALYASEFEAAKKHNNPRPLLKMCRGKHLLSMFSRELGLGDQKSLESKILNNIDRDEGLLTAIRNELPKINDSDNF